MPSKAVQRALWPAGIGDAWVNNKMSHWRHQNGLTHGHTKPSISISYILYIHSMYKKESSVEHKINIEPLSIPHWDFTSALIVIIITCRLLIWSLCAGVRSWAPPLLLRYQWWISRLKNCAMETQYACLNPFLYCVQLCNCVLTYYKVFLILKEARRFKNILPLKRRPYMFQIIWYPPTIYVGLKCLFNYAYIFKTIIINKLDIEYSYNTNDNNNTCPHQGDV